jgi:hypothetical protein
VDMVFAGMASKEPDIRFLLSLISEAPVALL